MLEKKNKILVLLENLFCFILKCQCDWTSNSAIKVSLRLIYRRMQLRWQRLSFWPIYKNKNLQKFVKNCIAETTQLPEVSHCPAYMFFFFFKKRQGTYKRCLHFSLLLEKWLSLLMNEIRISCLRKLTHLFILSLDKDAVHIFWGTISCVCTTPPTASLSEMSPKRFTEIPSVPRLLSTTLCCWNHRLASTFIG